MGARSAWKYTIRLFLVVAFLAGMIALPGITQAAPPVVKTVPWIATNPLIPHDTYTGKAIRLKGTCSSCSGYSYTWDFGDGSPVLSGTVGDPYNIEALHTYVGDAGTIWTARLTVTNPADANETANKPYYVQMRDKTLSVEVNVAIDEGLWYLHKTQSRYTGGDGKDYGYWSWTGYRSLTASNVHSFEVNGHLESGSADNPYTETVARGLKEVFAYLTSGGILNNQTNVLGQSFNPDTNGNGIALYPSQGLYFYQGGMYMDAIVASGTPNATATTGPANVIGRTYKDIVQDMADGYFYCQYDGYYDGQPVGGGWRYSCNEWPDNSACQWAAIGLIAAERVWGITIPPLVKDWNKVWLAYSQAGDGHFGYTDSNPVWGYYAVTPSGMVQMAMNGVGRGDAGTPNWDNAETFMCNNFCNTGGPYNAVKDYYYGLFSFTKSMLLHTKQGNVHDPIHILQSTNPANNIDWYAAEAALGARCDGVARTLVNEQSGDGWWWYNDPDGTQQTFDTSYALIMLNRTLFEAGAPVAVAAAVPNPGVAFQTITLDGSASFHQDPARSIVAWQWDLDNNGTWDAAGPTVTASWPLVNNYLVKLRVTDDNTPPKTADTIVTVQINTPPLAPTAEAGGPYTFCIGQEPWYLDGSKSVNPDEGQHDPACPACPGDTIQTYAWDLPGGGDFNDAFGVKPDVTQYFQNLGLGHYLVQLKVTDTTATSFPSSGQPDLTSLPDSAEVNVKAQADPDCNCITNLAARAKSRQVQLTWKHVDVTKYPAWHHYNIYRSTTSGGPYVKIATSTSTYSTYLDTTVTNGTTYYYVVRAAKLSGVEICQSNQASAKPMGR